MSKFFQKIQSQKYNPKLLGMVFNPFYFVRRALHQNMKELSSHITGKVLDVGCGTKPYEKLFTHATEYIGMDYDSPENRKIKQIDVFYDTKKFPFADETFDGIIFTQVLEHVFNPDEFLTEINRTLKKGGSILMSVPFVWDEHSQPYDYARYSSFGVAHLLKEHGFTIIEHRKSLNDIRVIFQLIACYIHKSLPFKNYYLKLLSYAILIAPVTIIGSILYRILPKNNDLYMDNIIVAKK
ncbi:MAG: class I SAM-dependent methyltransferase [Patescibacteria group bacterium]